MQKESNQLPRHTLKIKNQETRAPRFPGEDNILVSVRDLEWNKAKKTTADKEV